MSATLLSKPKFFGSPTTAEHFGDTPTIPEFFRGRHVFVTGGSGFMGKVLLEKLLRSCPEIGSIFVLLRRKKAVEVGERLKGILAVPLFDKIRSENPNVFAKLIAVPGDVTELGLGMRSEDRALVQETVSVVFHTAASVRFDEPLKRAVITNVRGTRETIELALGMTKLKVFLHVSTAYCNCDQAVVREKMYPPHGDWRRMIRLAEDDDMDQILCSLTPKILGYLPNTYTYAKSLSEHLIKDYEHRLPVVIFRPSIVVSTVKEPMPGWIDNFNGPAGLLIAGGVGLVRTLHGDPDNKADYVPVDYSIRSLIVAAWHRAVYSDPPTVSIYNSTSLVRPIRLDDFVQLAKRISEANPLNSCLWYPDCAVTPHRRWHFVKVLLLHMLPALIVDSLLSATGRKPRLLKLQKSIYIANMSLARFMFQTTRFENGNCMGLHASMRAGDLEEFGYDKMVTNLFAYMTTSSRGAKYLLHETEADQPAARARQTRLYWLHMITRTSFQLLVLYWATSFLGSLLPMLVARLGRPHELQPVANSQ